MTRRYLILFLLSIFIGSTYRSYGQNTIGTIEIAENVQDGYTLFAPSSSKTTYLIDNCGNVVNQWVSQQNPGLSAYLTPQGNLVRTRRENNNTFFAGGTGGAIEIFDWFGSPLWEFVLSDDENLLHHDIALMDNGNILAIAYELISQEEALSLGRDFSLTSPGGLWIDVIIEIKPLENFQHEIVWKWRSIDHIVQDRNPAFPNFGNLQDNPGRLDINFFAGGQGGTALTDWMHSNAIDYNEELDQIILNSRNYSEFYIIDHSTTTAEASTSEGGRYGKGGDILYRWGNPSAYNTGSANDQKLFSQHDAHWIDEGLKDEGKILVFNNGLNRPGGTRSTVDIIAPPIQADGSYLLSGLAYGPAEAEWTYGLGPGDVEIDAPRISGVGRQPNGNTLITVGPEGRFIEIDQDRNVVWKYVIPLTGSTPNTQGDSPSINTTFRSYKYPLDYPAFLNNNVVIGEPIENEPNTDFCLALPVDELIEYTNPISIQSNLIDHELRIHSDQELKMEVIGINGVSYYTFEASVGDQAFEVGDLPSGMYVLRNINTKTPIFVNQRFIKI